MLLEPGRGGTSPGGAEKPAVLQDLEDLARKLVLGQRAKLSEPQCSDMDRTYSPQQNSGLDSRQERIRGQLQGGQGSSEASLGSCTIASPNFDWTFSSRGENQGRLVGGSTI